MREAKVSDEHDYTQDKREEEEEKKVIEVKDITDFWKIIARKIQMKWDEYEDRRGRKEGKKKKI